MKKGKSKWIVAAALGIVCLAGGVVVAATFFEKREIQKMQKRPENLLSVYMEHISNQEYEEMYEMIHPESSKGITKDEFIERNSKIYEGIEMENMKIENVNEEEEGDGVISVAYRTTFDTLAGEVQFENQANFIKGKEGYEIKWSDNLIHPDLSKGDKVQVNTTQANRGGIFDRNGVLLAGAGTASSVGIVPGKLEDRQAALEQMAALLEIDAAAIEEKLAADWVQDDSFVPIKTIPKVQDTPLLSIPGVMISDVEVREYPLKEAAAHLIGYVQNVTAEDLENHEGEGYTANSLIGKSGMEGLFEKELKGENGCDIYITNVEGVVKSTLASIAKQDGEDVKLTIDAGAQLTLYEQFQTDKSSTVAMNPYTGEVLALVSTPSFNNNDFIMGMSDAKWNALNEDANQPMYNRFRQVWSPGSTFKPVIGAIGLQSGAINPEEDYGNVGLSWQKDASWGDYFVTTLQAYDSVVLENALIYSDNIYFAKAALKIGAEELASSLDRLGFNQEIPFEIALEQSQYSNTDSIESEMLLADSGYGQGQILVNPIHLASIYTSFVNNGNVIKPYLLYSDETKTETWIPNAFSEEAAGRILEGMKKVVNEPQGTGYSAHRDDMVLAGKTGTAEIKASQEDTAGTELGWFAVLTTDPAAQKPILVVSMAEDVKEIGGSGYVVTKVKNMLDTYLSGQ